MIRAALWAFVGGYSFQDALDSALSRRGPRQKGRAK